MLGIPTSRRVAPPSPPRSLPPIHSAALALAALALSCAAPAELARRSESALATGDSRRAFEWAERAMRADPDLPRAREAMTAAVGPVSADWQRRIRALAGSDTIAGARLSLEFAEVRARVGGWGIAVPLDSTYLDDQFTIRRAAARQLYDHGTNRLEAGRPREAYRAFMAAGEIVPGFRDVAERADRSFALGLTRVAVIPFEDDAGVPGLSVELAEYVHGELVSGLPLKKYPFVRIVPEGEVLSLARAEGRLTREAAIRIGRSVGANRIVIGRIHGLRSDTNTETWHDRVYRKVEQRNPEGGTKVRWDEVPFETVSRERRIAVSWNFEVVETDEEASLAGREGTERIASRVVFTRFDADGDPDDYVFAPPHWKSERADDWKGAERTWKERHGDWSVSDFLEDARERRGSAHYRRSERERYVNASRPRICDELPPAGDLAYLALRDVANPVREILRELEREP